MYTYCTSTGGTPLTWNSTLPTYMYVYMYPLPPPPPPPEDVRFVQNPIAAPAILGKPFELRCKAVGVPPPDYLWFKERVPLKEHRSPVLRLDKVGRDDEGSYCCRATNGTTVVFSSWAEVHVHSPPVILRRKSLTEACRLAPKPLIKGNVAV